MKLGLVTVLFKSDDMLPGFLESISMQDHTNYMLYLIDNSPSNATRQVLQQLVIRYSIKNCKHIECNDNIGVAAANNLGIKAAIQDGCDDIIILNNDIEFSNVHLFSSLIDIASVTEAAVIAPKVLFSETNKLWYAGSDFIVWNCNVRHTGEFEKDTGQYKSGFTAYAPTCFVYVKRDVFLEIGMMDETYFVYVDDLDFMYRLTRAGRTIWYENNLSIYHKVSQSTGGKFSRFSLKYSVRNRIYFARKFFSFPHVVIVAAYVLTSFSYHLLLKEKKPQLFLPLCKAIYEGFLLKPLK